MKKALLLIFSMALVLCLASCGRTEEPQEEKPFFYISNDESVKLMVPGEYDDLLRVEWPEDGDDSLLFTVFDKASYEAGVAAGHDEAEYGDGWLFSIGRISKSELDQEMCADMSNAAVFARDGDGNYYMFYHASDVRFFCGDGVIDSESDEWKRWEMLNEWAYQKVRDSLIEQNPGLVPYSAGNTEVDIYLARLACWDDVAYTLSAPEFGPLSPDGVDAAPYVARLRENATFEYVDESVVPEGEPIVLDFYKDGVRLVFFLADGYEYVRRVYDIGDEELYRTRYDGAVQATDVLREWYDAIAAAQGLKTQTDDSITGGEYRFTAEVIGYGNDTLWVKIVDAGDSTLPVGFELYVGVADGYGDYPVGCSVEIVCSGTIGVDFDGNYGPEKTISVERNNRG